MTVDDDAEPQLDLGGSGSGIQPRATEIGGGGGWRRPVSGCSALSVALAVVAAVQSSRLHDEQGRRRAVEDVAGRFTTAVADGVSGTRRTVASYIELRLVRVSGRWRVDGVTNLNFGQGQGAAGVPTTPTTAPG